MGERDFENRLRDHYDGLWRYACAIAGSRMEGEDLLQEALIRAWRARQKLRDERRFLPWVFTIIKNTYRNSRRRKWMRELVGLEKAEEVAFDDLRAFEDLEWVRECLAQLPLAQREALVLHKVNGYKLHEVARIQRVSVSAVKNRVSRGKQKMLQLLETEGKEAEDG